MISAEHQEMVVVYLYFLPPSLPASIPPSFPPSLHVCLLHTWLHKYTHARPPSSQVSWTIFYVIIYVHIHIPLLCSNVNGVSKKRKEEEGIEVVWRYMQETWLVFSFFFSTWKIRTKNIKVFVRRYTCMCMCKIHIMATRRSSFYHNYYVYIWRWLVCSMSPKGE